MALTFAAWKDMVPGGTWLQYLQSLPMLSPLGQQMLGAEMKTPGVFGEALGYETPKPATIPSMGRGGPPISISARQAEAASRQAQLPDIMARFGAEKQRIMRQMADRGLYASPLARGAVTRAGAQFARQMLPEEIARAMRTARSEASEAGLRQSEASQKWRQDMERFQAEQQSKEEADLAASVALGGESQMIVPQQGGGSSSRSGQSMQNITGITRKPKKEFKAKTWDVKL